MHVYVGLDLQTLQMVAEDLPTTWSYLDYLLEKAGVQILGDRVKIIHSLRTTRKSQ